MSNNTNRNEVSASQNQKEVTINESDGILDGKLTDVHPADFTSADVTLTLEEFRIHAAVRCDNVTVARDLNLPAGVIGDLIVDNTGGTAAVTVNQGTGSVAVAGGSTGRVYCDGVTNSIISSGGGGGGGGGIDVQEGGVEVTAAATTLNFAALDFDVADVSGVPNVSLASGAGAATVVNIGGDSVVSSINVTTPQAQVDFTDFNPQPGETFFLVGTNIVTTVDADTLALRVSLNNGSTFEAGASSYRSGFDGISSADLFDNEGFVGTFIILMDTDSGEAQGNATNENSSVYIELGELAATGYKQMSYLVSYVNNTGQNTNGCGGGYYEGSTAAINAVRIFMETGNITGRFTLYRRSNSQTSLANLPQPIESTGCLVELTGTESVAADTLESDQTPAAALSVPWDAAVFNDAWTDLTNDLTPQFWLGAALTFNGATDVDPSTDNITLTAHGKQTGMGPYTLDIGVGTVPTGLTDGTDYWLIRVDDNTVRLATSYANAISGTQQGITADGSGTMTLDGSNRVHVPAGIERMRVRASARFADSLASARYGVWVTHNDGAKTDGLPRSVLQADAATDEFNQVTVASGDIPVAAGDWFELRAGQGSGSAVNLLAGDTWLSVEAAKAEGVAFSPEQVLWVEQEETAGTDGGSAATGSYVTRTLNTIRKNTITGATLTSNAITLPPGTYRVTGSAPASDCNAHKARLRNTTDGATLVVGTSEFNDAASQVQTRSSLQGEFTLTAVKTVELQHRVAAQAGTVGETLGVAANLGEPEVYGSLFFQKVA